MMDWIHCNSCFYMFRDSQRQFIFTSCGHILCSNCTDGGPSPVCKICRANYRSLKIPDELVPNVQSLFVEQNEQLKAIMGAVSFQQGNKSKLILYQRQKIMHLDKQNAVMGQKLTDLQIENQSVKQQLAHKESDLKKLDSENRNLKQQLHQQSEPVRSSYSASGSRPQSSDTGFPSFSISASQQPTSARAALHHSIGEAFQRNQYNPGTAPKLPSSAASVPSRVDSSIFGSIAPGRLTLKRPTPPINVFSSSPGAQTPSPYPNSGLKKRTPEHPGGYASNSACSPSSSIFNTPTQFKARSPYSQVAPSSSSPLDPNAPSRYKKMFPSAFEISPSNPSGKPCARTPPMVVRPQNQPPQPQPLASRPINVPFRTRRL